MQHFWYMSVSQPGSDLWNETFKSLYLCFHSTCIQFGLALFEQHLKALHELTVFVVLSILLNIKTFIYCFKTCHCLRGGRCSWIACLVYFFYSNSFLVHLILDCFTALSARGARRNRDSGGPRISQGIPCGKWKHVILNSTDQKGGRESWPMRAGVSRTYISEAGKHGDGVISQIQRC